MLEYAGIGRNKMNDNITIRGQYFFLNIMMTEWWQKHDKTKTERWQNNDGTIWDPWQKDDRTMTKQDQNNDKTMTEWWQKNGKTITKQWQSDNRTKTEQWQNYDRHLCFNITEKGHMIVPDWYNRILDYTRKYCKNSVFQWK